MRRGFRARLRGTKASHEEAIKKLEEARRLYVASGDRTGEAAALNAIGFIYYSLGEKQLALEYYNQALSIHRAIGDRSGEGDLLDHIGVVYASLGESKKALEYYAQALPLRKAAGDRRREAYTLTNSGVVYYALGENQKAQEYYGAALPLMRAVGDRGGEAYALANIPSPSSTNRWLLKIEPGIYQLQGTALQMRPWVDIEGSGIGVTTISLSSPTDPFNSTISGASDAELRLLTVEATASRTAMSNNNAHPRIYRVKFVATGLAQRIGMENIISAPRI